MSQPRDAHDYVGEPAPRPTGKKKPFPGRKVLVVLASLKVTTVLFVLALLLVFFGTLAQKRDSLNTVLGDYFYCYLSWLDLNLISDFTQVFFKFRLLGTEDDPVPVRIPFPGGFTIGWLMVLNLTAAHLVRFKLSWKRIGLWVLHAGAILLLVGEFIRANYAVETQMSLREGQTGNFLFSLDKTELAFLHPTADGPDEVVSLPGDMIEKSVGKGPISHPDLPFDVEVLKFMKNTKPIDRENASGILPISSGDDNPANSGVGIAVKLKAEKEFSSVKSGGRVNEPGCYVTLKDKTTGKPIGTFVFGTEILDPQSVGATDKGWHAAYRLKRTYLPYTVQATKVERVDYPGTERPKEFKSTVRIENPITQEGREVVIEMNTPLRYQFDNRTYYQSKMDSNRAGNFTGFQVVQNPGAHVPYWACGMITLGMGAHFFIKLLEFLQRRARR